jgi:hypothetical protein
MNVNEVVANRAIEILGGTKGNYNIVHPLNDVNMSQSTNDVYPTALRIAAIHMLRKLSQSLAELQEALQDKENEFSDVLKLGRTELMDALPMTEYDRAIFTLRLLASGLVEAYERGLLQPRPLPPYNTALQRGANRLAVDLLLEGQTPPTDLATLFRFCHKPLHQWGLRLPEEAAYGQLLVDGVPTDTCHSWAIKSANPEWEMVAQLLPKLMDECRIRGKP